MFYNTSCMYIYLFDDSLAKRVPFPWNPYRLLTNQVTKNICPTGHSFISNKECQISTNLFEEKKSRMYWQLTSSLTQTEKNKKTTNKLLL